ncbi:hypothetical protein CKO38_08380 [Rhodospirillum rubrum]|uniref:hypothetical protein n=1 Tax=Rhodospirillum rubrum TaxID=1085 RepID=UPI0019076422|nr:hypothetical protein [Rhodospirillum rubrum]MBK1663766.1 hypothetical protein [Rhodospirillum rubrum]MBK1676685.1 hypothetical protein [Rhodospirillum rubrum]
MIRNTLLAAATALVVASPLAFAEESRADRAADWLAAPVFDVQGALVGTVANIDLGPGNFPVSVRIDTPSGRDVTLAASDFSLDTYKVVTPLDRGVIDQMANGSAGMNAAGQAN